MATVKLADVFDYNFQVGIFKNITCISYNNNFFFSIQ